MKYMKVYIPPTADNSRTFYFNNAATSFPKPIQVLDAIRDYLLNGGFNPGRSIESSVQNIDDIVLTARKNLAKLTNVKKYNQFVFTSNATDSLNMVIHGCLKKGDNVVTTSAEHNSVLRPLRFLQQMRKIKYTTIPLDFNGNYSVEKIKEAIQEKTKMIILNHASNVIGTVYTVEEISKICKEKDILLLIDGSQTIGAIPTDLEKMQGNYFAFTGHKSLFGPTGIGGLYIESGFEDQLIPQKQGGTGFNSEELDHPIKMPMRFEAGTPNYVGIIGLNAGLDFIIKTGLSNILKHKQSVLNKFVTGLDEINQKLNHPYKIYGDCNWSNNVGTVSINFKRFTAEQFGFLLYSNYKIITRTGLQCAPLIHKYLGTYPEGTVRFSFGFLNTIEEIEFLLNTLQKIAIEN